jgi:hypothetical protein
MVPSLKVCQRIDMVVGEVVVMQLLMSRFTVVTLPSDKMG